MALTVLIAKLFTSTLHCGGESLLHWTCGPGLNTNLSPSIQSYSFRKDTQIVVLNLVFCNDWSSYPGRYQHYSICKSVLNLSDGVKELEQEISG